MLNSFSDALKQITCILNKYFLIYLGSKNICTESYDILASMKTTIILRMSQAIFSFKLH